MKIDLNRFEKVKESENYILYMQKNRKNKHQIEIIVQYKKYKDRAMRCLLTDELIKLFFEPEEYKRLYMNNNQKQR